MFVVMCKLMCVCVCVFVFGEFVVNRLMLVEWVNVCQKCNM